jgi:predicted DNA-binding transcriptional regulator AlpA
MPTPNSAPANDAPEPLWDVNACAQYLGRSPRWVWAALRRRPDDAGSIPHVRIGRSPRFFPDDIAAWVRQGCPPAAMLAQWQEAEGKARKVTSSALTRRVVLPSCGRKEGD